MLPNRIESLSMRFPRRFSWTVALFLSLSGSATADVSWVHLSYPRLFSAPEAATLNQEAFAASVAEIEHRIDNGESFDFVAVTGDLGVASLLRPTVDCYRAGAPEKLLPAWDQAVGTLTHLLKPSRVEFWIFLPGGGDLIAGCPEPGGAYRELVAAVAGRLEDSSGPEIVDLGSAGPAAGLFEVGRHLSAHLGQLYPAPPIGMESVAAGAAARGFQTVSIGEGGAATRTLWRLEGGRFIPRPDSSLPRHPHLDLARALAAAGRRAEAEAAYRKAAESPDSAIRTAALAELNEEMARGRFLRLADPILAAVKKFLEILGFVGIPLLVIWSLTRHAWRKRLPPGSGNNRLRVLPLAASPAARALGSHFVEVAELMLRRIDYHFAVQRKVVEISRLPLRSTALSETLGSMATKVVPKAAPVVAFSLRYLFEPEYILEGSVDVADGGHHLVVRLESLGRPLRAWERSGAAEKTVESLKDVAFEALMYIKNLRESDHA